MAMREKYETVMMAAEEPLNDWLQGVLQLTQQADCHSTGIRYLNRRLTRGRASRIPSQELAVTLQAVLANLWLSVQNLGLPS